MDTTIALIFSLGLALGGQDSSATGIETTSDHVQSTVISQRQQKVRQRIKVTNAWLSQRKQARRALIQNKQQHVANMKLAMNLSCTAEWQTV